MPDGNFPQQDINQRINDGVRRMLLETLGSQTLQLVELQVVNAELQADNQQLHQRLGEARDQLHELSTELKTVRELVEQLQNPTSADLFEATVLPPADPEEHHDIG